MSNLAHIGTEVQQRLEEVPGPGMFWQLQAELYPLIVEGMNEAMLITGDPELKLSTPFQVAPQQTWQAMPAGLVAILRIEGPDGLPIKKETLLGLDRFQPGWENDPASADPVAWFPLGLTQWGIYPQLSGPMNVLISGIGWPVNVARPYSGTEAVPFGEEYREGFAEYAAHVASFKEGGGEFEQSLIKYRSFRDKMLEMSKFAYRKDSLRFALGPAGGAVGVTDVMKK